MDYRVHCSPASLIHCMAHFWFRLYRRRHNDLPWMLRSLVVATKRHLYIVKVLACFVHLVLQVIEQLSDFGNGTLLEDGHQARPEVGLGLQSSRERCSAAKQASFTRLQ